MLKMRVFILSATLVIFAELAGAQLTPSVQTTSAPAVASAPPAAGLAESATTGPAASDPALPPVSPQPTTEDKRAYGVLPNYRTAEASAPFVPLTAKQKLVIATKDTIDGPSYILAGLFSGLYQLENQNPSFGQGVKGYARRYGSAIADQDIGNYMTEGFLPVLLHEDPRFFRRGHGGFWARAALAARGVVVARTDHGNLTFNFSEFLGNGVTAAVGNAYYPDEIGFSPTMARMFTQIGTDAFSNVLKEFWPDFKRHVLKKQN
jgi:hypothetical protein